MSLVIHVLGLIRHTKPLVSMACSSWDEEGFHFPSRNFPPDCCTSVNMCLLKLRDSTLDVAPEVLVEREKNKVKHKAKFSTEFKKTKQNKKQPSRSQS